MSDQQESDVETPLKRGDSFLTLPVILVIGWIIWEVTEDPAFAALAMCLKFAWEDFRTARWLHRIDPDRGRAKACAWFHVAAGLWQAAVIGVAMVLLTVALASVFKVGRQGGAAGPLSLILGAMFAIVFGFVLSTMATIIAMLYARRFRVRPWLNGAVHFARRRNEWPPLYGHRNRVMVLVVSATIVACCLLLPICLWIATSILWKVLPPKAAEGIIAVGIMVSVVMLMPALLLGVRDLRRRRFFAEHPVDCWGEEPLPDAQSANVENRETVV